MRLNRMKFKHKNKVFNRLTPLQTEEGLRLAFALAKSNKIIGDYYEFGVQNGDSLIVALELRDEDSYFHGMTCKGFDSWEGLQQNEGIWEVGEYSNSVDVLERTADYADCELLDGYFENTLKDHKAEYNPAIIHIDCDLYSSTKTVLEWIEKNAKESVLLFDDYYMNFGLSEKKAMDEWTEKNKDTFIVLKHKAYGVNGQSFLIKKKQ